MGFWLHQFQVGLEESLRVLSGRSILPPQLPAHIVA